MCLVHASISEPCYNYQLRVSPCCGQDLLKGRGCVLFLYLQCLVQAQAFRRLLINSCCQ